MEELQQKKLSLSITKTKNCCPVGESVSQQNINKGKIPVFASEGGCIRGEIARQAANIVAKQESFGRGCHGELFAVPDSSMTRWVKTAEKVVLIDGCFLKCHKRILENLIDPEKIIHFDALSHYKKYTDLFEIDAVPEEERMSVAQNVAKWVIEGINNGGGSRLK